MATHGQHRVGTRHSKDYPQAVPGSSCPRRQVRREDRATGDRVLRPTRWCVMVRDGASVKLQGFRTRKLALKRQIKRDRGKKLPVLMAGYYEAE